MGLDLYLSAFEAQNPRPLAETPRAHLWRVDTPNGPAVLKVLTDRGVDAGELTGAEALRLWNGDGAVHLLGLKDRALLLEWLPGPTLGDMVRGGKDNEAAQLIAELSLKLRRPASTGFRALKDHYDAALTKTDISSFPPPYRDAFSRAQALWHALLETTQESCLLHGDLHHDNILRSQHGWSAIDPKGIIGDPCYEFGIVFRNPIGEEARAASPARILSVAGILAAHTGLDETRILQFGLAHVALSLAYHYARGHLSKPDLAIFLAFYELNLPLLPLSSAR